MHSVKPMNLLVRGGAKLFTSDIAHLDPDAVTVIHCDYGVSMGAGHIYKDRIGIG